MAFFTYSGDTGPISDRTNPCADVPQRRKTPQEIQRDIDALNHRHNFDLGQDGYRPKLHEITLPGGPKPCLLDYADFRKIYDGIPTRFTTGPGGVRLGIKKVIFNDPATIIIWFDDSKTVVKVQDGEPFDEEKGFAMAVLKKMLGNQGNYYNEIRKWVK